MKLWVTLFFVMHLLPTGQVSACFHYPNSYRHKMTEGRKNVFLFHDGENAHMVIQTSLQAPKFPSEIAWVLPFPSLPSKYEQVDGPFFESLVRLLPKRSSIGKGSSGMVEAYGKGGQGQGIKVHEAVVLNHYQIQPIEILKDDSSKEFKDWLKKNKFNPMPYENQKDYLKKGAVFLAIRMKLDRPSIQELRTKPLHIVYKSDRISFPLKFTHSERTFDLNLYVFGKSEMKKDLGALNLYRRETAAYNGGDGLYPFVDDLVGKRKGFVTSYEGVGFNVDSQKVSALAEDPFFLVSEL